MLVLRYMFITVLTDRLANNSVNMFMFNSDLAYMFNSESVNIFPKVRRTFSPVTHPITSRVILLTWSEVPRPTGSQVPQSTCSPKTWPTCCLVPRRTYSPVTWPTSLPVPCPTCSPLTWPTDSLVYEKNILANMFPSKVDWWYVGLAGCFLSAGLTDSRGNFWGSK